MKIVIAGGGKVGEKICLDLAAENHDVILIEQNERILTQMIDKADITGLVGNGALTGSQEEAGVRDCDIFIAVTAQDETNIIAAITAKALGATTTMARVRNPDYTQQMNFLRSELGINRLINPELQAAQDIFQRVQFPAAVNVDRFVNGRVYLVELPIPDSSKLIGQSMKELRASYSSILVCILQRKNGDILIPTGNTRIKKGDHIHVTGAVKDLDTFYNHVGLKQQKLRKALIIGGGRITSYLVQRLLRSNIRCKIIEENESRARHLAERFPEVEIILGDGTEQAVLLEEHIDQYDVVIPLTGIDEENLLISLFARQLGVRKTISKVNRLHLLPLLEDSDELSVVTPKQLVADEIIRLVRGLSNSEGSNVEALYRLMDGEVEALQFVVSDKSACCGHSLLDLPIRQGVLLAYIVRDNQLIFPTGSDVLLPKDRIILMTTHQNFDDLDDILEEGGHR